MKNIGKTICQNALQHPDEWEKTSSDRWENKKLNIAIEGDYYGFHLLFKDRYYTPKRCFEGKYITAAYQFLDKRRFENAQEKLENEILNALSK